VLEVGQSKAGASRPARGGSWRFTEPAVLLLLTERPSHGYELVGRLKPMFPRNWSPPSAAAVYRLLRGLEDHGSVRSVWAVNPGAGPARHVYELTDSGRRTLDRWVPSMTGEVQAVSGLLAAYLETATESAGSRLVPYRSPKQASGRRPQELDH
jgi:DNA-binding PadR family transcriptional regulator